MISAEGTRKFVKNLALILTENSQSVTEKELLQNFPYNIQKYVDEIGQVGWATEQSYLKLNRAHLAQLSTLGQQVDCHSIYLFRDSSIGLSELAANEFIRTQVLERYAKSDEAVLLIVSERVLEKAAVNDFLVSYPETVVMCFSSESVDAETGERNEQWTIHGYYAATLSIERGRPGQLRAKFLTISQSTELSMILSYGKLVSYESLILKPGVYSEDGRLHQTLDGQTASLDYYGNGRAEGRFKRGSQNCAHAYICSSEEEGTFVQGKLISGTNCENDIQIEHRVTYPGGDTKKDKLLVEKVCFQKLTDADLRIELVDFQSTNLGVVEQEGGTKIEGYMDSSFQPTLALITEGTDTSIKPSKYANQIPEKRTIWIVEVGESTTTLSERTFLNHLVELCDFIGLPFLRNIKYSSVHKRCKEEEAEEVVKSVLKECSKDDLCHLVVNEGTDQCLDWLTAYIEKPNLKSILLKHKSTLVVSDLRTNALKDQKVNRMLEAIEVADREANFEVFLLRRRQPFDTFTLETSGYVLISISLEMLRNGGLLVKIEQYCQAIIFDDHVVTFGMTSS